MISFIPSSEKSKDNHYPKNYPKKRHINLFDRTIFINKNRTSTMNTCGSVPNIFTSFSISFYIVIFRVSGHICTSSIILYDLLRGGSRNMALCSHYKVNQYSRPMHISTIVSPFIDFTSHYQHVAKHSNLIGV